MENFKMDRKSVAASSFKEADDHTTYYKDKTPLERLNNACFIINQIFQVSPTTKIDKTIIQSRKNAKSI
jgi:hypothetical protein